MSGETGKNKDVLSPPSNFLDPSILPGESRLRALDWRGQKAPKGKHPEGRAVLQCLGRALPSRQNPTTFPEAPGSPECCMGEPAPNLGLEGSHLLLQVLLGLLLLLQLLLEGVLLVFHLFQFGAQAQLLPILLLEQLLFQRQAGCRLRRCSIRASRSPHP